MVKHETGYPSDKKDADRLRALDLALVSTRLLDPRYFDEFAKAVNTKDYELFNNVCGKSGIPEELRLKIWDVANAIQSQPKMAGWPC